MANPVNYFNQENSSVPLSMATSNQDFQPMHANEIAEYLLAQHPIQASISLTFGEYRVKVFSNHVDLVEVLNQYFNEFKVEELEDSACDDIVHVFESKQARPNFELIDWIREGGKSGRKDAFYDLPDGRLMHKVRTGMNYVQNQKYHIAYGPCFANQSQVINFVLTQHMTHLQNQGSLICHSSAVAKNRKGIALSAFAGGGKSTLALKLMNKGLDFVSNDRLFINTKDNDAYMYGVAKQPRINPGTVLNNPTLSCLIGEARKTELLAMKKEELWDLEEKYDAPIDTLYGTNKFKLVSELQGIVVLNWSRNGNEEARIDKVDLNQRSELLDAVVKSPGPFHYDQKGQPWGNGILPQKEKYLEHLKSVDIYEITGTVNFEDMANKIVELFFK